MIADKSLTASEKRSPQISQSIDVNKLTLSELNERMDDAIKKGHLDFLKDLGCQGKKKYYWQ